MFGDPVSDLRPEFPDVVRRERDALRRVRLFSKRVAGFAGYGRGRRGCGCYFFSASAAP